MPLNVILLSGGSGARLWPLSSSKKAKQFLKVLPDKSNGRISMVQRTFAKVKSCLPGARVTIATSSDQVSQLSEQISGSFSLAVEPERRDTAPAIMLACSHLYWKQHVEENEVVVVLPIDSFVEDHFFECVADAARVVRQHKSDLALVGVQPVFPSAKYGYIVPEEKNVDSLRRVTRFIEKPNCDAAANLLRSGSLWNCGVFCFRLEWIMKVLNQYVKCNSYEEVIGCYSMLPKNSFDYEVVEHAQSVSVATYRGFWKDLGTWSTLTEEMDSNCSGSVYLDSASCENTFAINELEIPMIVAGVPDAVVVATSEGILVCSKERSAQLKDYLKKLSAL